MNVRTREASFGRGPKPPWSDDEVRRLEQAILLGGVAGDPSDIVSLRRAGMLALVAIALSARGGWAIVPRRIHALPARADQPIPIDASPGAHPLTTLERAGCCFGDSLAADPLFRVASLPHGWRVTYKVGGLHKEGLLDVVDQAGASRAAIFYDASNDREPRAAFLGVLVRSA